MNLHVPQSLNAVAEAKNLMMVDKMIVSLESETDLARGPDPHGLG